MMEVDGGKKFNIFLGQHFWGSKIFEVKHFWVQHLICWSVFWVKFFWVKIILGQKKKEKSWELAKACRSFLQENNKDWVKRKRIRDEEDDRRERLEKIKWKKREIRITEIEDEIARDMEKIPKETRDRMINEEMRMKRLEMTRTKKDLWSLRSREIKFKRKSATVERLEKMETLEEKKKEIEKVLEKIKESEEKEKLRLLKKREIQEKEDKERKPSKKKERERREMEKL